MSSHLHRAWEKRDRKKRITPHNEKKPGHEQIHGKIRGENEKHQTDERQELWKGAITHLTLTNWGQTATNCRFLRVSFRFSFGYEENLDKWHHMRGGEKNTTADPSSFFLHPALHKFNICFLSPQTQWRVVQSGLFPGVWVNLGSNNQLKNGAERKLHFIWK